MPNQLKNDWYPNFIPIFITIIMVIIMNKHVLWKALESWHKTNILFYFLKKTLKRLVLFLFHFSCFNLWYLVLYYSYEDIFSKSISFDFLHDINREHFKVWKRRVNFLYCCICCITKFDKICCRSTITI